MTFIRLDEHSDWGTAYQFRDGDPIAVKWPDGTLSIETVKHKSHQSGYSDQGRWTSFSEMRPGVAFMFRGVVGWVSLRDLLVNEEDVVRIQKERQMP